MILVRNRIPLFEIMLPSYMIAPTGRRCKGARGGGAQILRDGLSAGPKPSVTESLVKS
jgi:hypothetical protein